jgi:hypothetical protein
VAIFMDSDATRNNQVPLRPLTRSDMLRPVGSLPRPASARCALSPRPMPIPPVRPRMSPSRCSHRCDVGAPGPSHAIW